MMCFNNLHDEVQKEEQLVIHKKGGGGYSGQIRLDPKKITSGQNRLDPNKITSGQNKLDLKKITSHIQNLISHMDTHPDIENCTCVL